MSLKKNVIANYLGQGWTALMGLAFVPLYIKYLGMEAYGLIGVCAMLQAWLTLLDMGMTPTLNREMARYTAGAHTAKSIRNLLRSLEVICFGMALLIGIAVWFGSTWLATHWLQAERLPVEKVAQAISIMGFVVALRFIEALYRGVIIGLQRQVWLNAAGSILATLRSGGAVLVLIWLSPDIEVFFLWQGFASMVSIVTLMFLAYRLLPSLTQSAKFSLLQLQSIWRFAGGMMATTLLSLLLMQVDKVILSKMLSLEMFGYYTLAGSVAAVLSQLVGPIDQAFYPRFTELVAKENITKLISVYHQGAQLISVMLIPVALMLAFFGENVLMLWTGNTTLAQNVAPILALLVLGNMLNGFLHMPYLLTLAYGWPSFAVRHNVVAVILLVPAIIWVAPRYGAIGAAWIWVILNSAYILISVQFVHRRLLKTEKWCWYLYDVIFPILAILATVTVFLYLKPEFMNKFIEVIWLLIGGFCFLVAAILSTPHIRKSISNFIPKRLITRRLYND